MKKLRFLMTLIILVPQIGVGRENSDIHAQEPFSIWITTAETELKAGVPIQISVRVTNLSDHPISASSAWEGSTDMSFEYDVRDASGRLYQRKTRGKEARDTSKIRML